MRVRTANTSVVWSRNWLAVEECCPFFNADCFPLGKKRASCQPFAFGCVRVLRVDLSILSDRAKTLRLFDCPRTYDEDVHEPSGALLPVGARRHVGDADQRPEQIEWLQVSTDVAAFDCAFHQ